MKKRNIGGGSRGRKAGKFHFLTLSLSASLYSLSFSSFAHTDALSRAFYTCDVYIELNVALLFFFNFGPFSLARLLTGASA